MNYQLSKDFDKNRLFIYSNKELEDRLDPFFYTPQFEDVIHLEQFSKYPLNKISQLSHFVTDGIHKTPTYSNDGLPFIQSNNISEGEINFVDNVKRVSSEWYKEVISRYKPEAGDVLVTKDGTIGVAATVPEDFNDFSIFVSVLAIRPKKEIIIPEFLRIMISSDIVQKQIYRSTRGAVLSHLLLEEARELKIPVPPISEQKNIVEKMHVAICNRKKKENESKDLLRNIDEYLLDELEINYILNNDISIEQQVYVRNVREVTGGRFDPFYYLNRFEKLQEALGASKHLVKLGKILDTIESGSRPKGGVSNISEGVLSLGGEHVDNQCGINVRKPKFIPYEYHDKYLKTETRINDLLLVKDGATTGKIGIVSKEEHVGANINEHLFLLRTNNQIDPVYLLNYLNSRLGKQQIEREITGGTVTGITRRVVRNLKVIMPGIKEQNKIANNVTKIRKKIQKLQEEARDEFIDEKIKIQSMVARPQ